MDKISEIIGPSAGSSAVSPFPSMDKYIQMSKELSMLHGVVISPADIPFDIRAIMKCRWGGGDFFPQSIECHVRDTTFQEQVQMVSRYNHIGPLEAAQAAQWIGCELAIPIHYFDPEDPSAFADAVKILAPWMEVKVLSPGDELALKIIRQGARTTFILGD